MGWRTTSLLFCAVLGLILLSNRGADCRIAGIRFMSDPIELLLQDSYASLKRRSSYNEDRPPRSRVVIRKRKYNPLPTFYTSNFGFAPNSLNSRKYNSLPYADLLFSGRKK